MQKSDNIEFWNVWLMDYYEFEDRPFIHRKIIPIDELTTEHIKEIDNAVEQLKDSDIVENCIADDINLGNGIVNINITLKEDLFYKILSEVTEIDIKNEGDLFSTMSCLSKREVTASSIS